MVYFQKNRFNLVAAVLFFAAGVINVLALSNDDEKNVAYWYDKSQEATSQGEYDQALQALLQAREIDQNNPEVRLAMGNAYIKLGNVPKAVKIWEQLVAEYPSNYALKNNLAWVYATTTNANIKNGKKAVAYAKEAALLSPLSYEIWNTLSEGYTVLGEYKTAYYTSQKALDYAIEGQCPEDEIQEMRKQVRKNRKLMEAAKDTSPIDETEAKYWTNLGEYAMKRGQYREALAQFCVARLYNPDGNAARFGEASVYIQIGKYRKGLDMLEELAKEYPNNYSIKNNIAWIYATARDFSVRDGHKAVEKAQEALMIAPDDYHVWSTLSEAYFMLGDYERALRAAETALRQGQINKANPNSLATYQSQVEKSRRAVEAMSLME